MSKYKFLLSLYNKYYNYISKKHIINLFIIFVWIIFFVLNWITYTRFMYFLTVLEFILIYRIVINKLEITKTKLFNISNSKILNFIIFLNKYRNPVLLFLIKWDILMYDFIIYYNNKILNYIIYCIYLIMINPLKILYYKFYVILWIWKTNKIWNILLNRMFGLILSVLIFTNVINYMTNTLHLNLFVILYIYLLVISISCEIIKNRDNKLLKIFLVLNITTKSIIWSRLEVNILSIILKKSNIDENSLYIDGNKKIEAFQIGYTYYIIDSLKYFESKPSYWLYFDLRSCVEDYLMLRIDSYVFFSYYDWNVPNIEIAGNKDDLNILKIMYEYDYKVFKALLYLYWDLEYYLGNYDYVENTLIVDDKDVVFLKIKFKNTVRAQIQFYEKIKYKDLNKFWGNFELIYTLLFKYDIYSKIYGDRFNSTYNIYLKYKDKVDVSLLRSIQAIKDPINPLYYDRYKEDWYEDWKSEMNEDLNKKYKDKIKVLDIEYNKLINVLKYDSNINNIH